MSPSPPNEVLSAAEKQWIFTEEEFFRTPSAIDGLPIEKERENRAKGVNFIIQVGIMLKLPQLTLATASVFLHRFFMRYSMVDLPGRPGLHYYAIAATSLFLATKVEENCRKMRELVIACCRVAQKNLNLVIDEQSKEYWRWRDTILHNEDVLLEALCFDLSLEPPYNTLFEFLMYFGEADNKKLRNAAWAFVNDSNLTMLCLLSTSRTIAAAALFAAARHCGMAFPDDAAERPWWEVMGVDLSDVRKACNYMAEVYEKNPLRSGGGSGMYQRVPENGADVFAETRRVGQGTDGSPMSDGRSPALDQAASAVKSLQVGPKRARAEEDSPHEANGVSDGGAQDGQQDDDIPWGGEAREERETKRQKTGGEAKEAKGNGEEGKEKLTNGNNYVAEPLPENGQVDGEEESLSEEGEVEP
jgi:protein BUR2